MKKKIGMEDLQELMDVKYHTVHKIMKGHPKVGDPSPSSLAGHPFPAAEKIGREIFWDAAEVQQWYNDNKKAIRGRNPTLHTITIPYSSFERFLKNYSPNPNGSDIYNAAGEKLDFDERDHFKIIHSVLNDADSCTIKFERSDDAFNFTLRYG